MHVRVYIHCGLAGAQGGLVISFSGTGVIGDCALFCVCVGNLTVLCHRSKHS